MSGGAIPALQALRTVLSVAALRRAVRRPDAEPALAIHVVVAWRIDGLVRAAPGVPVLEVRAVRRLAVGILDARRAERAVRAVAAAVGAAVRTGAGDAVAR